MPPDAERKVGFHRPNPMNESAEPLPPDPTRLAPPGGETNGEIQFLVRLRRDLNATFELFDEHGALILPPALGVLAPRLRRLALQGEGFPFHAVIKHVIASGQSHVQVADGLSIATARIKGPNLLGAAAIALAKHADAPTRVASRDGIELMVVWLANLVAGQRAAADSSRDIEWRQMAAFCRVVSQQAVLGSEIAVLRVFIEALAIWDDLDVRAYSAGTNGAFSERVALNGADRALTPSVIDPAALPDAGSLTRLAPEDIDSLGLPHTDVVVARLRDGGHAYWLLVMMGDIPVAAEPRLAALVSVLTDVLRAASAVETSRLTWALLERLISWPDAVEDALAGALQQLTVVTGRRAGLVLARADGAVVLSAGHADEHSVGDAGVCCTRTTIADSYELLMTLEPSEDARPFRDQRLLEAAASVFGSWIGTWLTRADVRSRRLGEQRFEDVLQQQIEFARTSARDLSLIIVKPSGTAPVMVRKWVREVRGALRGVDIAVALPTGEVGIVLPDTSREEAVRVAARLQNIGLGVSHGALLENASMGAVSLAEEENGAADSLLLSARTRAGLVALA